MATDKRPDLYPVGEKVKLVGKLHSFEGEWGYIIAINEDEYWPYEVFMPEQRRSELFFKDELRFENGIK